ncbi:hypothetical protein [Mycobacterium timonense]|uniref:hypothetical protein n=1 Tax=Mycobacterium timonense TaxID=701043 RepID=UPI001301FB0A|nr:hypothetical protein [Mycobacterium timonense]
MDFNAWKREVNLVIQERSIWDRVWPWLRHPFSTAAATIAFRYVENHPDLEIRFVGPT